MSAQFENVTILAKANVYFGGKVTSRTVLFPDGSRKTLGFMQAGDYEFGTTVAEKMEVLGGEMTVRHDGESDWNTYREGDAYDVPANAKFFLQIPEGGADYCCSYL